MFPIEIVNWKNVPAVSRWLTTKQEGRVWQTGRQGWWKPTNGFRHCHFLPSMKSISGSWSQQSSTTKWTHHTPMFRRNCWGYHRLVCQSGHLSMWRSIVRQQNVIKQDRMKTQQSNIVASYTWELKCTNIYWKKRPNIYNSIFCQMFSTSANEKNSVRSWTNRIIWKRTAWRL